jgi:hypothetical protein
MYRTLIHIVSGISTLMGKGPTHRIEEMKVKFNDIRSRALACENQTAPQACTEKEKLSACDVHSPQYR